MIKTKSFIFLKVTYFTLIVFVLETIFFRFFSYIHDYFSAVLIISYAVLGIGLGAFFASKIKISEKYLFLFCSLGFCFSLYLAIIKIVLFASPGFSNIILFLVFLFPSIYVATIYTKYKSNKVYFFDLVGCFFAVVVLFLLYKFFISETIFLLVVFLIPLIALINIIFTEGFKYQKLFILLFLFFLIPNTFLFYNQIILDKYNFFNLINCDGIEKSPEGTTKIFCRNANRVKTYDNLTGRIDVTKSSVYENRYIVSYDGWPNDMFNNVNYGDYKTYQKGKEWPIIDIRFLYGNVSEPKVLIIGSSAAGIVKPIKQITPLENTTLVEINPAILKMMQKDFFEENGRAYAGLTPILANGISFVKSTDKKFDMITMLNTHSYRNLGHQGVPDYLHTTESYNLFLDHLTDAGYIMIEERPESPEAKLALYRQINTIWQTLKKRGIKNPEDHFIIWTWTGGGGSRPYNKYSLNYYVSMVVGINPINRELMAPWAEKMLERNQTAKNEWIKLEYFKGHSAVESPNEFTELFDMIKNNNLLFIEENFDSSPATNNRPFLSHATLENKKINRLILNIGILSFLLWIVFTIPLIKSNKRKKGMTMNLYFILIGFSFFLIEIILFQAYQNIFLSSSSSFVLVLGLLLFSAGIGGYFSEKIFVKRCIVFLFLLPFSVAALYLPDWFLRTGFPAWFSKIIGLILISATGFFMGFYFPRGLIFAKKLGLRNKVYYFFAINAIAGCFAVVLALYLGIKIGYIYTLFLALIFYLMADLILLLSKKYALSFIKK